MQNRNCFLPPLLRAFQAGYVPQRKFSGIKLEDAIRFVKGYYPKSISHLSMLDSDDFKYKTDGLVKIFAALPEHVTSCTFNVRYLNKMSDAEITTLFAGLPSQMNSVNFYYVSEYREYPHLDFADVESQGDKDLLSLDQMVRLIKLLPERLQVSVHTSCIAHLSSEEQAVVNQHASDRNQIDMRVTMGMM